MIEVRDKAATLLIEVSLRNGGHNSKLLQAVDWISIGIASQSDMASSHSEAESVWQVRVCSLLGKMCAFGGLDFG